VRRKKIYIIIIKVICLCLSKSCVKISEIL